MALVIKENKGAHEIHGNLTANTAETFESQCKAIMNEHKRLMIDVQFMNTIDNVGIDAIKALYMNALYKDCGFFIQGNRSKKLYEAFPFTVEAV